MLVNGTNDICFCTKQMIINGTNKDQNHTRLRQKASQKCQIQLLLKASTPLHVEPLDFLLNVIDGIGCSNIGTAWIIT